MLYCESTSTHHRSRSSSLHADAQSAVHCSKGQVKKSLSFQPAQTGNDWFLSLNVDSSGVQSRFNLPVSANEIATLRTLATVRSPLCCCVCLLA